MTKPMDSSQIQEESGDAEITTRRHFLSLALAGPVALAGTLGVGAYAFAKDGKDDDDEEDEDNSGHGNSHDGEDDDDSGEDDHGGDPRARPAAEGVTSVEILDEVFVPNHIAIRTGQTVTWINRDDDDHTASGRGMDTGIMNPGASGSVTFLEPGEYDYTCNFHPEMLGLVVVTGESVATPEASPVALPMTAAIDIIDLGFDSDDVVVAVGAEVIWTNTGAIPHTVTFDFASSDVLDAGDTYTFVFEKAGTFDYICAIHPGMAGRIDVREQSTDATPTANVESDVTVEIVNFAFQPTDVHVKRGGSVTWTNTSETPHTVRGDFGDSDIMDPGAVITFAFNETGSFEYICALHPNMVGTVTVSD